MFTKVRNPLKKSITLLLAAILVVGIFPTMMPAHILGSTNEIAPQPAYEIIPPPLHDPVGGSGPFTWEQFNGRLGEWNQVRHNYIRPHVLVGSTEPDPGPPFDPGDYSLLMTQRPNANNDRLMQWLAFEEGVEYEFSVWLNGRANVNFSVGAAYPPNPAWTAATFNNALIDTNNEWQLFTWTFTPTANGSADFIIGGIGGAGAHLLINSPTFVRADGGPNMLGNSSFRDGHANWAPGWTWGNRWPGQFPASGWDIYEHNPGGNGNGEFNPGRRSLLLQGNGANMGPEQSGFPWNPPYNAGSTGYFDISLWVKGQAESFRITASGSNPAGTFVLFEAQNINYNEWTQLTATNVFMPTWPSIALRGISTEGLLIDNIALTPLAPGTGTGISRIQIRNGGFEDGSDQWLGWENAAAGWIEPGSPWSVYQHPTDGVIPPPPEQPAGITSPVMRIATDENVLFVTVEGGERDTRNIYFISIDGAPEGYTRQWRPNVHYIVANSYLFRVTGDHHTDTPEFVENAVRLGRVRMEYHTDHTIMTLNLDQIGNPNPEDISISWQGWHVVRTGHPVTGLIASQTELFLPSNPRRLLPLTAEPFARPATGPNTVRPSEYYGIIFNPMIGGGSNLSSGGPTPGQMMAYAYVSWRDLQPERGVLDLDGVRMYSVGHYPVLGPNGDQWPATRAPLITNALEYFAEMGAYVNLRFIMDYPAPGMGSTPEVAMQQLRNRSIADIPCWLIEAMREEYIDPRTGQPYGRPYGLRTDQTQIQAELGWFPDDHWGPEGVWYVSLPQISGGFGLAPRYDHHLLLYYHEQVINALAEEIARPGSPWNAVANVQIGSLGHWGEFHNWPTPNSGQMPHMYVVNQFIQHYVDAFAYNPNVQLAIRYAFPIATQTYWMGQFHDEVAHTSHAQQINTFLGVNANFPELGNASWGTSYNVAAGSQGRFNAALIDAAIPDGPRFPELFPNQAARTAASRDPAWWMYAFSGGEYGDQSAPVGSNAPGVLKDYHPGGGTGQVAWVGIMNAIRTFRYSHTSNMAPRGPEAGFTNADNAASQRTHKNNDALFDNMGYRFVIEEFTADLNNLQAGATVNANMAVWNRGVAPFYRAWPLEVSFIDANGQVAGRYIVSTDRTTGVDIRTWLPRHGQINNALNRETGAFDRTYAAFNGRNVVNFQFQVPSNLNSGAYTVAIAILDPVLRGHEPGIKFANHNASDMPHRQDMRLLLAENVNVASGAVNFRIVNFDINYPGGTNPDAIQVVAGEYVYLPTTTRAGYTFAGWFTEAIGGTRISTAGNMYVPATNASTLFAQWRANEITEFNASFNIFNNGPGGSPSRPNASLEAANTIRMWTQLNGANTPFYLAAEDTIVAIDQDGNDAMEFVRVAQMWAEGQGWQDYFAAIDINKDGAWQYINFYITVHGQTVHVLLANANFVARTVSFDIFNNGPTGSPSRPNASLAASNTIRMWTQLDGVNTPFHIAAEDTIVATDQDGNDATEFIRITQMWVAGQGWQDYFASIDINKNGAWQYINFYITAHGQTIHVLLANGNYNPFNTTYEALDEETVPADYSYTS